MTGEVPQFPERFVAKSSLSFRTQCERRIPSPGRQEDATESMSANSVEGGLKGRRR